MGVVRAVATRFGGRRAYGVLVYREPGAPVEVLNYEERRRLPAVAENRVHLKILAAPINPADLNTIEGAYPQFDSLPSDGVGAHVPGHDGVGCVQSVGSKVQGLSPGDWVIPLRAFTGTWREEGVFDPESWHKIPNTLPLETATTLAINSPTAWCLLHEFEELNPGDVVIQNAATSAVGQAVIQIAKAKGIQTINLIRNRPQMEETVHWLKELGATVITTEEKLQDAIAKSGISKPILALNAVGGEAITPLIKPLLPGSVVVTYGGMSKEPLSIPTSALIFKDLTFRGFWWSGTHTKAIGLKQKATIIDDVSAFIQSNPFRFKFESFPMSQYRDALARHAEPYRLSKVLLTP